MYYLTQLLGKTLYDLFVADLVNKVPVTARFLDLYNPFDIDDDNCLIHSDGMKEMIMGFIQFFYAREAKVVNTQHGNVVNNQENADRAVGAENGLVIELGESIELIVCLKLLLI